MSAWKSFLHRNREFAANPSCAGSTQRRLRVYAALVLGQVADASHAPCLHGIVSFRSLCSHAAILRFAQQVTGSRRARQGGQVGRSFDETGSPALRRTHARTVFFEAPEILESYLAVYFIFGSRYLGVCFVFGSARHEKSKFVRESRQQVYLHASYSRSLVRHCHVEACFEKERFSTGVTGESSSLGDQSIYAESSNSKPTDPAIKKCTGDIIRSYQITRGDAWSHSPNQVTFLVT